MASAAVAQIPAGELPGRQAQRFTEPPAARARPGGPTISLPSTIAPVGAEKIKLTVRRFKVVGATAYSPEDLTALYQGFIGHPIALSEIYGLAQKITAKYGQDGYALSRAIVPPQELDPKGATITIQVVEGYIDRVEWPAGVNRYTNFFSDYAAKITAERPINIHTIERYLLLASDLPGLTFGSTLKASVKTPAASTLVVTVTEKKLDAGVRVDNRGTEARGPYEFLTTLGFNNLTGKHEAWTFTYAGATETRELQYGTIGFRQVLSSEGVSSFADASYSLGKPGTAALKLLEYQSHSVTADWGLSSPIIRTRERNLTLSALAFLSDDQGDILSTPNSIDRMRGFRLKADADWADFLSGTNQVNLTFSQGIEGLGSTKNDNPDASRASGRVDFTKVGGTLSRVQPLNNVFSVRLAAQGQYAGTPLLASEECGFGGKDFGRAFDPSVLTGDHCWASSAELRFDPAIPGNRFTQTQFYGFIDYGEVFRLAPASGTATKDEASSAGVGLRLGVKGLTADLTAAAPLTGKDRDWQYFFNVGLKY